MTIVYNKNPGGVSWNVQGDDDDTQRTYKGRVLKRDPNHSAQWLLDGMRFKGYRDATGYIDKQ